MIITGRTPQGAAVYVEPSVSGLSRVLVLRVHVHGGDGSFLTIGLEQADAVALHGALTHLLPELERWVRSPTSYQDAKLRGTAGKTAVGFDTFHAPPGGPRALPPPDPADDFDDEAPPRRRR